MRRSILSSGYWAFEKTKAGQQAVCVCGYDGKTIQGHGSLLFLPLLVCVKVYIDIFMLCITYECNVNLIALFHSFCGDGPKP